MRSAGLNGPARVLFLAAALACASAPSWSAVDVLTHRYDNNRQGLNARETRLTASNVKPSGFGKLFEQPVDGQLYAQPLIVTGLSLPGKGTHDVVYAATEANTVYAFDANNASGGNAKPLWQVSLVDTAHGAAPGATAMDAAELGVNDKGEWLCGILAPKIGITGTPVIDRASKTMWVAAKSKENGVIVHRLHALDITTGAEKPGSPVAIPGALAMPEAFDALWHFNRPALLLNQGTVYVAYGSHCDGLEVHPYRGWVFSFDAASLKPKTVLPITRGDGSAGSVWMSGAGPAADAAGQVFVVSGDGTYDGVRDFSDAVLKLDPQTLAVKDVFTPADNGDIDAADEDLGSGGAVLLPDQAGPNPHLLVIGTKDGRINLLNRDKLGAVVQSLPKGTLGGPVSFGAVNWLGLLGSPTWWNQRLYFWGYQDVLKAYTLSNGQLNPTPLKGSVTHGYPGTTVTVSANGNAGAVVWSIKPGASGAALLEAWDALSLAPLYSSDQNAGDDMGASVKFTAPVVANGRVYVGGADRLVVYGRRFKLLGKWWPSY